MNPTWGHQSGSTWKVTQLHNISLYNMAWTMTSMRLSNNPMTDSQSRCDYWLWLAWESPECLLPKEQSTMCHTHQTLPVLVHVCHDDSDASSQPQWFSTELLASCMLITVQAMWVWEPLMNWTGIKSFPALEEKAPKTSVTLHCPCVNFKWEVV